MITKKICNCSRRSNGRYNGSNTEKLKKKNQIDQYIAKEILNPVALGLMPNVPEGSLLPVNFHFTAGSLWVGPFDRYATVLAPKNFCGLKRYSCFAFTALHKVLLWFSFWDFSPKCLASASLWSCGERLWESFSIVFLMTLTWKTLTRLITNFKWTMDTI